MKLSLIVPVYNMERYLPRFMESAAKQTGDFELILVDDGSTDGSAALCDGYAAGDPDRIRVVHKPNGGLSSARNAGMAAARGEYVIFPDPDDWLEPDYTEKALSLLEPGVDLVCLGYAVDYDDRSVDANPGGTQQILTAEQARRALILPGGIGGFAWNKCYRLDRIREYGLQFLDDTGTVEDLDFAYRYLAHCGGVVFAPQYRVYHYYQRPGAATHSGFSRKKLDSIHTYEKILADTLDPVLARAAREEICNWAINLTVLYQNAGAVDREDWSVLRRSLKAHLGDYLTSRRYGPGRKVQALLALAVPGFYARLKRQA